MKTVMTAISREGRQGAVEALHAATALYTVADVVDALLDRLRWPGGASGRVGKLADTSCGDGMFLARAIARLLDLRPSFSAEDLVATVEAWEIHPGAANEAKARVADLLEGRGWGRGLAEATAARIVRNADFLTQGPPDAVFDTIVGNPPYLRFANVPALLQDDYARTVPAHARADLLHAFLDRCARALAPDGEIALVTADRWLFNMTAARLREELGQSLGILHLERLDAKSAFYRPKRRTAGAPPRIHPVAVVLGAQTEEAIRLTDREIYPGEEAREQKEECETLGDIAQVRLAPWLGTKGIFVVDAEVAARLPDTCLIPAVDTDDIIDGRLRPPRRFAILTTKDCRPPDAVMAHLERELPRMAKSGRRTPIWVPPENSLSIPTDRPSLLVPRITRELRAVPLPAGVLPVNHNLSIVSAGRATLEEIADLLASEAAQAWFEARAPRLESGYRSLSTTLLRKLPVFGKGRRQP